MDVLTVRAARKVFGLPMDEVQEIVDGWSFTPLPLLPAGFRGVTSVRGTPVPVADLARLAGGAEDGPRRTMVVLRTSLALLVDTVETVVAVEGVEPVDRAPGWVAGAAGDIHVVSAPDLLR